MAERILPSGNTLVKYDNPVLVTKRVEKYSESKVMYLLNPIIIVC